jgi:hypothetical protein
MFKKLLSGIDSLYIGFNVDWFDGVIEVMESHKEELCQGETKTLVFKDLQFELKGHGTRGFQFIMDNNLFNICMTEKNSSAPNVRVQFKSFCLWRYGLEKSYDMLLEVLEYLGTVKGEKISRVDLCADYEGLHDVFSSPLLINDIYSRARKIQNIYDNRTISYWGIGSRSGKFYARIYNKSLEMIQKKSKFWFLEKWGRNKEEVKKNPVWRVEFEVKREGLREMNIDSFYQLKKSLCGLWKYLTCEWLQFKNDDNSNDTRKSYKDYWIDIQSLKVEFQGEDDIVRSRFKTQRLDVLMDMIKGCFTSGGAILRKSNKYDMMKFLSKYLDSKISQESYVEEIENKIPRYQY